jgi:predicted outer membrane repeat protein
MGGALMTGGPTNTYTNCAFLFCEVHGDVHPGDYEDGYLGDGGGALHLWQSIAICNNCSFINCFCNHYGGVVSQGRSIGKENFPLSFTINFTKCIFGSNKCILDGGAIMNRVGTMNIDGCSFLFNEAGRSGGAIYCELIKNVSIKASAFVRNTKTDTNCSIQASGGAIMVWYLDEGDRGFELEDCFFGGNKVLNSLSITECQSL